VACLAVSRHKEEELLEDLLTRYQSLGIVVWGEIEGASGTYAKILVKSDGTVKVEGITTISGTVDVSDRWARQVGQIDIARYLGSAIGLTNPLHSQIVYGGAVVDPRSIRALVKTTDELYSVLRTDAGVAYDARQVLGSQSQLLQQKASTYELLTDVVDRAARQMGLVYGSQNQILQQKATTYELLVDTVDRAARLVGIVYGSLGQLQQRATSLDLYTALRYAGLEIDPRSIRALSQETDHVMVHGDQAVLRQAESGAADVQMMQEGVEIDPRLILGSQLQQLQQRASTYELLTTIRQGGSELSASNPLFAGIVDASGNRMPSMDAASRPGYIDIIDEAARLLGIIYGDQGQLAQRATTRDAYVQVRSGGSEIDPRLIQDIQKTVTIPTAGGGGYLSRQAIGAGATLTIKDAPGAGYKLRLKRLQVSVDAITAVDLRWGSTAFESYYLPANGSIIINKIGENFDGPENTALTILSTNAVNITASSSTETLAA